MLENVRERGFVARKKVFFQGETKQTELIFERPFVRLIEGENRRAERTFDERTELRVEGERLDEELSETKKIIARDLRWRLTKALQNRFDRRRRHSFTELECERRINRRKTLLSTPSSVDSILVVAPTDGEREKKNQIFID